MDGLSELGNKSLGFQPQTAISMFFSLWLILSVIAYVVYRVFRGGPDGVGSEFAGIAPEKKKRG
jgi:hypothetical protein